MTFRFFSTIYNNTIGLVYFNVFVCLQCMPLNS